MRGFLFVSIIAALLITGCSSSSTNNELESYFDETLPLIVGHGDITEECNEANMKAQNAYASGDTRRYTTAVRDYRDKLAWAMAGVRSELNELKTITPPKEVRTLHEKLQEGWSKELDGLTYLHSYYSDMISYGYGSDAELQQGNALLAEAWGIWQQVRNEMDDLVN